MSTPATLPPDFFDKQQSGTPQTLPPDFFDKKEAAGPDLKTGAGMEAAAQQQAKERLKQVITPPKQVHPPVYTGPGAWPPGSEQAQEKFLGRAVPALPYVGGAVGGLLGGIPGAAAGGIAGESLRGLLQPEKAATTAKGAAKELAIAGAEQAGYEFGGKLIGKAGAAIFKEGGPATKFLNNLIRADVKSMKYGANPGTAILKDVAPAATIPKLLENTRSARQSVGQAIGNIISQAPAGTVVDYAQPIMKQLSKEPNQEIVGKVFDFVSKTARDMNLNLSKMTPQQAFDFKEALQSRISFTEDPAIRASMNAALERLYRPMSNELTSKVPGLSILNKRYMNLKSAENVVTKLNKLNLLGKIHPEIHLDRPLSMIRDVMKGLPASVSGGVEIANELREAVGELGAGNVARLLAAGAKEVFSSPSEQSQ